MDAALHELLAESVLTVDVIHQHRHERLQFDALAVQDPSGQCGAPVVQASERMGR
jgi:hypothetical protein